MKQPKILVFTVSSWNSKVGSNTWETLLEKYGGANVANVYIRNEAPDSLVCSRYFNISENKILKSVFNRKIKTGCETTANTNDISQSSDLEEHNKRYSQMRKKRRYSMLIAREIAWKLGKWHTEELDEFLDSFAPDIILHSMEGYIHLNRIIEYSIERTGAKAIGYIWDDNFTYSQHKNFGYRFYRFFQRRSLKRLVSKTKSFFAISDMTKREADEFFGIDCQVLTKPLNRDVVSVAREHSMPLHMLYTGNLFIGRDRSLQRVVNALRALEDNPIILDVYTQTELSSEAKYELERDDICKIHDPISQSEVLSKQREADILLFLEDIDGPDAHVARLSFSTKITDYLSSCKCILAIGCAETAPIQYFIDNHAAAVATSDDEIIEKLSEIVTNTNLLRDYAEKARELGIRNHSKEKVLNIFNETINSVMKERDNNVKM